MSSFASLRMTEEAGSHRAAFSTDPLGSSKGPLAESPPAHLEECACSSSSSKDACQPQPLPASGNHC
ncbi:unnamed protein product [Lota lota]